METTVPVTAETETKEALQLAVRFEKYAITAPDQYKTAADDLKTIKGKAKELDDLRKSMTKPLDDSKKRIMDLFRVPMERLADAESSIKSAMITYQQEQERIRQAEESRLREIQRQREEQARKEQERLFAEAQAAEKRGNAEKAEAALRAAEFAEQQAKAAAAVVTVVAPTVRKISGISTRKAWKYRIIDDTKIPREYLMVDEAKIGKTAREFKDLASVEGVQFYAEDVLAAG